MSATSNISACTLFPAPIQEVLTLLILIVQIVGIGKPEPLKYRDGYSRMIDKQNRVFYDAVDGRLLIVSCRDHYED